MLYRDMAKGFPSSKAVNDALRVLAEAGRRYCEAKLVQLLERLAYIPPGQLLIKVAV